MKDVEQIWSEFKTMFPNSPEKYSPTTENVTRWEWHIREHETQKSKFPKPVLRPSRKIDRDAPIRAVSRFDEFPAYMVNAWGEIASHFPGVQVWACGSRVSGEYVEKWSPDTVRQWRAANYKKPKIESDYDFWIAGFPTPIGQMPDWADWVKGTIDQKQRIQIPMWDFSKLPNDEHAGAIAAFNANDIRHLLGLHDKYQLSPYNYCCEMDGFLRWWSWAIENGIIDEQSAAQKKTDNQLD